MTRVRYAWLFLLALALAGCAARHQVLTLPPMSNADSLASDVLAAVIHDAATEPGPTPLLLLPERDIRILRRGYSDRYHASWEMPMDSLSPSEQEAEIDLERRHADSTWAGVPLRLKTPYRWLTEMKKFRMSGDGRVIGLSRVGFSADHRDALVQVGYYCGALCGAGGFVFLRRDANNVWHITHKYRSWVA